MQQSHEAEHLATLYTRDHAAVNVYVDYVDIEVEGQATSFPGEAGGRPPFARLRISRGQARDIANLILSLDVDAAAPPGEGTRLTAELLVQLGTLLQSLVFLLRNPNRLDEHQPYVDDQGFEISRKVGQLIVESLRQVRPTEWLEPGQLDPRD